MGILDVLCNAGDMVFQCGSTIKTVTGIQTSSGHCDDATVYVECYFKAKTLFALS